MEPIPEESVNTAKVSIRRSRSNKPWWLVVLLASIPCVVTGFFTYEASVVEAKAKTAEADIRAEAGYDALVKAVEILQKHDEEASKTMATLNGHIMAIEAWMVGSKPHGEGRSMHLDLPVPANAPDKKAWRPNFPAPAKAINSPAAIALPKSLDEAAKR